MTDRAAYQYHGKSRTGYYDLRKWRVGRSLGFTIYAVVPGVDDEDIYIGQMDTPGLARHVVEEHNARILDSQGEENR